MMKNLGLILVFALMVFQLVGCVEPYIPSVTLDAPDILVIDGEVDVTTQSARIKITHAVSLTSVEPPAPETGALVFIEDEFGNSQSLTESMSGNYEADNLDIDFSLQYRLTVQIMNGKIYQSDFVRPKQSPAIDSVTWRAGQDGVIIFVNTHDESGESRFYQWSFEETWHYRSNYRSVFIADKLANIVREREPSEMIDVCWRTTSSKSVLLNTTSHLSTDVVQDFELIRIEPGSIKMSSRYSILVKQKVLTREAFTYWTQIQKTTENLGGLFDPLPGKVTGNITCITEPQYPVLGYFNIVSVREHRIYIDQSELREDYPRYQGVASCKLDSVPLSEGLYAPGYLIDTYASETSPDPIGYFVSSRQCVDCTALGGVTSKPLFWQE